MSKLPHAAALAALMALVSGAAPSARRDWEVTSGMAFRARNSRERWKREVRRGRVVRHRR